MPTPAEAFGQALREARERRGLSQEETALKIGLDRAYYGHIERASKVPTLTTVWKVADAVGVKPSQLLAKAERILNSDSR